MGRIITSDGIALGGAPGSGFSPTISPVTDPGEPGLEFSNALSMQLTSAGSKRVQIPSVSAIRPTTAMTALIWYKGSAGVAAQTLFADRADPGSNRWAIFINNHASPYTRIACFISADGSASASTAIQRTYGVISDGAWHMVAMTFFNNVLTAYVDNAVSTQVNQQLGGTVNTLFAGSDSNPLYVGAITGGGSPVNHLDGSVALPALFNTDLSLAQIQEAYNSGTPFDLRTHSAAANLVWYAGNINTADFPTLVDFQGNSDGTYQNMVVGDLVADTP